MRDYSQIIGPHNADIYDLIRDAAGVITFLAAEHTGLVIEEPYPNWLGYKLLSFIVYSEMDLSVVISLRIEDSRHNNDFDDRFNRALTIDPGLNRISILLDNIRKAPATRDMDMTNIRLIHFFAHKPNKEIVLYFDDFRLE